MSSLKIYFGPYEAHGVVRHRTQKLHGILSRLSELGYEVELVPTKRLDALIIHMMDKEIYRCNIKYLQFNIDFEDDPVAQNVLECIEETKVKFGDEQNVPNFGPVNKRVVSFESRNYLGSNVDLIYEIPAPWLATALRGKSTGE